MIHTKIRPLMAPIGRCCHWRLVTSLGGCLTPWFCETVGRNNRYLIIGLKFMFEKIRELIETRQAYYDLIKSGITQQLGEPATPEEIQRVESKFECRLPDSYKQLLGCHNGCSNWEGEVHLLSTDQILDGEFCDWIAIWQEEAKGMDNEDVSNGLIIACELNAACGLILLKDEVADSGEMPILEWDNGPVRKYKNMEELIIHNLEDWHALIEEEKVERSSSQ